VSFSKQYEKALEECLQRILDDGEAIGVVVSEYPEWCDQLMADLETALWMAAQQDSFEPRSGFIVSTREHLLSQLTRPGKSHKYSLLSNERGSRVFLKFVSMLLVVVILFISGGGIALAAENALPGDWLFPIRRGVEDLRLVIVKDEVRDAELHLGYAQNYLVACAILTSQGDSQDARVALQQYDRHISRTSRILLALSESGDPNLNLLRSEFNRTFLQDIGIFQVLLGGNF